MVQLIDVSKRWQQMRDATNPGQQRSRLAQLEQEASREGFWDQQEEAAAVNQEMSEINDTLQLTSTMQSQLDDVATAVELIEMEVSFGWKLKASKCEFEDGNSGPPNFGT